MMYLGTLGRMVGIKCPTAQRVNQAERYTFNTTLGGTVKAQAGPVGRRTWDLSLGRLSTPSDVGTLMEFATGAWGSGPFWFVPVDAAVVNLLTPAASRCNGNTITVSDGAELLGAPPMELGDHGIAATSIWKTPIGTATLDTSTPVLPGKPVTGSAWVHGNGRLRLTFLNSLGSSISQADSPLPGPIAPERLSVTATAPLAAVAVHLSFLEGITHAARPAITWTTEPYEWGEGQGCPKAVIHNPSRDVVKAWDKPSTGKWSDLSFTVQEVG